MICRMFLFSEESNLNLDFPDSQRFCEPCKGIDEGVCDFCSEINESLTPEKFNWTLSRKIVLPKEYRNGKLEEIERAIRLIHPSNNAIWIIQKMTDNRFRYEIMTNKTVSKCDSISKLNYELRSNFKYDTGRDIKIEDFSVL